jgi:pilus assembly protein CpaD
MPHRTPAFAAAIALSLSVSLAACGGHATANRSLNSVHQPIVQTSTYALDLAAGSGGLPLPEQRRLAGWFEAMKIGYGDRITVDAPGISDAVRADVAALAGQHGMLLSEAAPATTGGLAAGTVRVTVTRSSAHVAGCASWNDKPGSATSASYGCATNSNLAAMVADPRHLLEGATDTGGTVVLTASKAIKTYREQPTTGAAGLPRVNTSED